MIGWRNTVRRVAGLSSVPAGRGRTVVRQLFNQDPIAPCGAESPHKSHTYPTFGPNGSKRYLHCEGVR